MAQSKESGLTALTGVNLASGDLHSVLDVSDTTMAATGTNKTLTTTQLIQGFSQNRIASLAVGTTAPYAHKNLVAIGARGQPTYGTASLATGTLWATPMKLEAGQVVSTLAVRKNATTSGITGRMTICDDLGTNRYPNNVLVEPAAFTVGGSHTGIEYCTASPLPYTVLTAGIYWFTFELDGTISMKTITANDGDILGWDDDGSSNNDVKKIVGLSVAHTYGALGATFPLSAAVVVSSSSFPAMYLAFTA